MSCTKGIFAKGIWGCAGFSLLRWEKGFETPSCGGEKGLRLPRSSCSDLGNEGVSDPFPHRKGVSERFSHRKTENPVHPQILLAKIPLAQRIRRWGPESPFPAKESFGIQKSPSPLVPKRGFLSRNPPFLFAREHRENGDFCSLFRPVRAKGNGGFGPVWGRGNPNLAWIYQELKLL